MKRYQIHHSSLGFYAYDFWADNKKEALSQARSYFGFKRMPNNTAIWEG